jgi:hypothetical protein
MLLASIIIVIVIFIVIIVIIIIININLRTSVVHCCSCWRSHLWLLGSPVNIVFKVFFIWKYIKIIFIFLIFKFILTSAHQNDPEIQKNYFFFKNKVSLKVGATATLNWHLLVMWIYTMSTCFFIDVTFFDIIL